VGQGTNDIGMMGLAVMGRNLALNIADKGFKVAAFNRTSSVTDEFVVSLGPEQQIQPTYSIEEFAKSLAKPRRAMIMVKAGAAVDAVIDSLTPYLEPGDIVIDGGNSHYTDTNRRNQALAEKGIHFLGVGISGGEAGARNGPSIMPGGQKEAYEAARPIFEAVAARAGDAPCTAYLGPRSAGHYVKMVHNGIEYGVMQLIAETYALLKAVLGKSNQELADIYASWNDAELNSYLVEITSHIFRRRDEGGKSYLVDEILGEAEQLGTGMWTSQSAMDLHVPVPGIDIAVAMRSLSALEAQRKAAQSFLGPAYVPHPTDDETLSVEHIRRALYAGMIMTYAQGFAQLRVASNKLEYQLSLDDVARVWRGGCIIRAALLAGVERAFGGAPDLGNLLLDSEMAARVAERRKDLVRVAKAGASSGVPIPGLMTSLGYLDSFRAGWLPLNLVQAQRDYFGAHTYRRVDREGVFHTEWTGE